LYFAIYSNSRAIQVSLLIGVIVTIIVTALKKSSFKKHLLLIVFQLILVYTLNFIMTDFQSVVSFFDREGLNSISSSRIDIWRNIIEVTMSTKKNFLIGTGPSTFYYYGATNHNAHNMIVEIFGSMGIIGLSAFIVLCIRILYRTIILVIKRSEYVYLLGLLAFMTSKWMLNSMMALTSIYFALIIALIINNYNKENKTNDIN